MHLGLVGIVSSQAFNLYFLTWLYSTGKIPKMSWLQGKGFRHGDIVR